MSWRIEYYSSDIEQAVLDLPESLLARYLHLTDLMMSFGSNLGMPHGFSIVRGQAERLSCFICSSRNLRKPLEKKSEQPEGV